MYCLRDISKLNNATDFPPDSRLIAAAVTAADFPIPDRAAISERLGRGNPPISESSQGSPVGIVALVNCSDDKSEVPGSISIADAMISCTTSAAVLKSD